MDAQVVGNRKSASIYDPDSGVLVRPHLIGGGGFALSADDGASPMTIHDVETGLLHQTIPFEERILATLITRDGDRLAVILATKSTRGGYERRLEIWNKHQM